MIAYGDDECAAKCVTAHQNKQPRNKLQAQSHQYQNEEEEASIIPYIFAMPICLSVCLAAHHFPLTPSLPLCSALHSHLYMEEEENSHDIRPYQVDHSHPHPLPRLEGKPKCRTEQIVVGTSFPDPSLPSVCLSFYPTLRTPPISPYHVMSCHVMSCQSNSENRPYHGRKRKEEQRKKEIRETFPPCNTTNPQKNATTISVVRDDDDSFPSAAHTQT